jgi:glyoxylase-like metal-dependent hydrolase (beta-lactamase superfamily II)
MTNNNARTISLGTATITVINVGNMILKLSEVMNVPESEWRPRYSSAFEKPLPFPSQSIHIALPDASILVDANNYAIAVPPDSPYLPRNYQLPPSLLDQLHEKGIRPQDITHLVITHAHFDHYAGTTTERDGKYLPTFPNACCYLGRADWEDPEMQTSFQDPASIDSRTFGVLHQHGLLELVEGNRNLTPAVQVIAAPGESAGHQLVRVQSEGQTLYCLGDLYHHSVEVEQPTWMANWANPDTNISSRQSLVEAALAEDALLVAAHMPIGRLQSTLSGIKWVEV